MLVKVKILDTDYSIKTDTSEERVHQVAEYVNQLMNEARVGSAALNRFELADMAAFRAFSVRGSPLLTRRSDFPAFDQEELVLVTNWLPHRITIGYRSPNSQIVEEVNGVKIRNLRHLVATLRDLQDDYVEFEFVDAQAETLVFNREQLIEATDDILLSNGIPRQGSRELLRIWQGDE